jgi:hypothetical protein
VTGRQPTLDRRAAVEVARRFVDTYNAAAAADDRGLLEPVATPEAVAGYLVESQSGVVAPLASRTGVPAGARLDVDPPRWCSAPRSRRHAGVECTEVERRRPR